MVEVVQKVVGYKLLKRSAQISVLVGLSSSARWFVDSSKREDAPIGGIKIP